MVEGLLRSRRTRAYGVIGDAVNAAKRICSAAAGGEVLASSVVLAGYGERVRTVETRMIKAKGKTQPIEVHLIAARG